MKKKIINLIVLILMFILGFTISASAYTISVAGGVKDYPVALVPYEGFTENSISAIYYSCRQWATALGREVVASAGWTHNTNVYKTSSDGQNLISRGQRGTSEYLMQTRKYTAWSWGKTYIVEADIDINVSHPFANSGDANVNDVQNCMTHEVGHMLGIGHSDVVDATMYEDAALGETKKRTLHADDRLALFEIYE